MTDEKENRQRGASWPSPERPAIEPFVRPKSVSERLTDQLREMIIDGRIRMGEQLSENTIANHLGVSRTPVREAFMMLEAEKLVEVKPQRGTFVFTCDADQAREICEYRAILEAGAMRLAAERDRQGLVKALGTVIADSVEALAAGPQAYQPFDTRFHGVIFEFAGNANLSEAYNRISGRLLALRWRLTIEQQQIQDSHKQHSDIVDLIEANRDTEADMLMRNHVNWIHQKIISIFENEPDGDIFEALTGTF